MSHRPQDEESQGPPRVNLARASCSSCRAEIWVRDLYTAEQPAPPVGLCPACRPKEPYEPWRRKPSPFDLELERAGREAAAIAARRATELLGGTWPEGPSRVR